ncbi:lytic transglycosylase domain-containing protein [Pseudomonas sp. REP124]|uniref:lytic transglycosylase domain-containing protein n=1 Tax=Pseudomonas sp. REP124 TaxID=2875731 RepID=UPI001CCCF261|nr:lytic transglycosylase domain-containing protein [Pseudomonas sp. REP124]MBZ9781609.1 lytic transglycosylase domain-containing protein [Pseudomonas sp. REP124]
MSGLFAQLEQENNLPSGLLDAVWSTESSRGQNMQSPKGAQGHFQFMPATAQQYGLTDPNNLQQSAAAAARMLSDMMQQTGSVPGALAAYNWGIGNVQRKGMDAAPEETRNYIQKVTSNMSQQSDPFAELNREFSQAAPSQPHDDPFAELNKEFMTPAVSTAQPAATGQSVQVAPTDVPQAPSASPDRLAGRNWLEKGTLGAGKAVADLLEGVGLGDVLWPRGWQRAPGADADLMSDPAGLSGNIGGQIGLAYLGGRGLQAGGKAIQAASAARAMPAVKTVGGLVEGAGNALINPASYKQAAGGGAAFGVLSQPGDAATRATNAVTGAVGGTLGMAVGRGIGKVAGGVKSMVTPVAPVETQIATKLAQDGIDYSSLPQATKDQMISIAKRNMDDIGLVDTEQLARMADFNKLEITPMRGWVTRDPKAWWKENNLNTVDSQVSARFKDANSSLLQHVSKGVGDATDYERGRVLQNTVTGYDDALKKRADNLYQSARNTAGRDIPLDATRFVNNASADLDQQMLGSKLPADTLAWFQKATGGQEPFDMGTALQRLQALNGRIYGTNDPAEAKALGIVKKHLVNEIEGHGASPTGAQADLSNAFKEARAAAADRFRFQEASPLIEKILKGNYAPEDLPNIVGKMKVDQLKGLSQLEQQRGVPIMSSLQDAARVYVRDASTLQSETGGAFSVNGMRKALDKIGPEKGQALFGKNGWEHYQTMLRVAGDIHNAPLKPVGSSTFPNYLRMPLGVLKKLPVLPGLLDVVASGAGKVKQMADANAALNPSLNLVVPRAPQQSLLPLLTAPGLLGITEQ